MALSGSFSARAGNSGSGLHHTLRVDWAAVQDIYGNRSTVTCNLYLIQDKGYSLVISKVPHNTCTIDGAVQNFTSPAIHNNGGTTTRLGTVSQTVDHESDGSKTLDITAVFYIGATLGGTWYPSITASATVTLDTIPRATVPKLSAAALTLGEALDIALEPAADFTHELAYRFGSEERVIAQNATGSIQWTPPLELAAQIPNSETGTALITCTTYQGQTRIGSPQTVSVLLWVPQTVAPGVSATWEDLSGAYGEVGSYVKLVSRLAVEAATVSAYGSPVTGVSMTLGGRAYTGGPILEAGALALVVTATDARGHTGSAAYPIRVLDYTAPQLTLNASRCTENGTADDTGSFALVTLTGGITAMEGNTAQLRLVYGFSSEDIEIPVGVFEHRTIIPADPDSTLTIAASLTDQFLTVTRSMVLSTGYATMDFLRGGRGIAFGTAATKEGFTCAMELDMAGKRVCNVAAPVEDADAVNLGYLRRFAPGSGGAVTARIEAAVLILEQTQPTLNAAIQGTVLVLGY